MVKTLIFLGYNVKTVMNITDVDDKTIRGSIQAGEKLENFTKKYTEIFLQDIKKMGITPADNIVPVTTLIPEMVRMINTLLKRGFAYMGEDNSIYYKISSFKKAIFLITACAFDLSSQKFGLAISFSNFSISF